MSDRPPVWVGHVVMPSARVEETSAYLVKLGLRAIETRDRVAVLELRGGTHLVVVHSDSPTPRDAKAAFDLMYEDVDAAWKRCQELGLEPSAIEDAPFHRSFRLVEPGGHEITVNSTHVSDLPV